VTFFVGIDGGGTRTRALVSDGKTVLARGEAGSCNPRQVGRETAHRQLELAIQDAFSKAGLPARLHLCKVYAGIAGLATETDVQDFERFPHSYARLHAGSDAVLALEAYFGDTRGGALLIIGTGCIALAKSSDGTLLRRMGWGYPLEQGGGVALGMATLRLGLWDWEMGRSSDFSQQLQNDFDNNLGKALEWSQKTTPAMMAHYAPLLFKTAKKGNPQAQKQVTEWVQLCADLLESIRLESGCTSVGVWGGLSEELLEYLTLPHYQKPQKSPLERALEKAQEL
jgi:glucosamine kinase